VSDLDAELTDIFRDEAAERLGQMETALLAVESGDAGAESVDSLFRNAHTIKGAAGMLGLDDIRVLAHAVEDVLAGVRGTGIFPPGTRCTLLRATTALARAGSRGRRSPSTISSAISPRARRCSLRAEQAWLTQARGAGLAGEARPPDADVREADSEADRSEGRTASRCGFRRRRSTVCSTFR